MMVTREGATVGTFDYVAPEQARHSHAADIRSDIYSLGCTLYHMVAGQVPFPSPSLPEKLFAHQALEPTPLNQIIPHISPEFVDVVQRMMRKQPEERYATPLQVAQALEPFIDEYPRIRDGEPAPIPLIVDEPAEQQRIVSPPVSGEVQPVSSAPVLQQVPQVVSGPDRESGSPIPNRAPEPGGGRTTAAVPSFLTPVSDSPLHSSTEDIPLSLDLGPEPSLTDSLSRPKSWFGPEKPVRPPVPARPTFQQPVRSPAGWPSSLAARRCPPLVARQRGRRPGSSRGRLCIDSLARENPETTRGSESGNNREAGSNVPLT